jgi:putative heme iron utilization protein
MRDKRASLPEWKVPADAPADEATMVSVDRLGFKPRITSGPRLHSARIPFPRELTTAEECRAVFIEMLGAARHRG